jgi:indole-3-glycerol phosphate synthase
VQASRIWSPPTGVLGALVSAAHARAAAVRPDRTALEARLAARGQRPPDFAGALRAGGAVRVIAEIKRKSPSLGDLAPALDAGAQAAAFAAGGAAAVSVLTEPERFGGRLEDLAAAAPAGLPMLRKDFIVDEVQVLEAAAHGASAILLIVAALPPARLRELHAEAERFGLDVLVEVHDADELTVALEAGCPIVGVNTRDLRTLVIDPAVGDALVPRIPSDRIAVFESGIADRGGVERASRAGADAVLVGSALSQQADPAAAVAALADVPRGRRAP